MSAGGTSILAEPDAAIVNNGAAIPWALIGAALMAMVALWVSAGEGVGLPILAVLLVASRFSSWRLPKYFIITYGSRAAILAVLVTLINQTQDPTVWYLRQEDTNLAGYALATDIVLRAWERRDAAGAREGLGVVVLMTALLFAAATDTYERFHIELLTPIYAVFLLLSFRFFALMKQPVQAARSLQSRLILLRAVVILLTLGIAFTGVYAVTRYEYQVTSWAMQFVKQHHGEQHDMGFSPSPHLSAVFNPEGSPSRVLLIDGSLHDAHLRIAAFDTYQDSRWLPAPSERVFEPITGSDSLTFPRAPLLTFTRLADTADLLAAPLMSTAIRCPDPLEVDRSGTIRDTRSDSFEPYKVIDSTSPTAQGILSKRPDEKYLKQLLAIPPEIDPKVIELARRVAGSGERARQVFRIQEYLRSHHAYALSFQPQGEPLNDFILNEGAAHCQYFASAVAIMVRAIGVPSRYVGGFYGHEQYGAEEIIVRQRDAHAWAECWIDGAGWMTVDATPAGGRPDGLFPDPPAWKQWWEKLTDIPGEIREWFTSNLDSLKKLAVVAALVGLCIWLVRVTLRRWGRRAVDVVPRYPAPSERLLEMARRFDRWMNQRGIACPPERTWRVHIAAQQIPSSTQCATFVQTYDRARFGDQEEDLKRAEAMLDRIEQSPDGGD